METSTPTVKDILIHARELVSQGWVRGAQARDRRGKPVLPRDPRAVRFSILGAIARAGDPRPDVTLAAFRHLGRILHPNRRYDGWGWSEIQDIGVFEEARTTTKAKALALLDKAIQALE